MIEIILSQIIFFHETYLDDFVDLVLDNHNKVIIAIQQGTLIFWFLSAYKSYIYTVL